ncbi:MAG TPA: hypothetical protein P5250_03175 [Bacteroidales bacterium]|nr:hypothetical protein [Bacteroidales bacterium]
MKNHQLYIYISRIIVILLIAIGTLLTALIMIKGDDAMNIEPLKSQLLNPFFITAYIAIIICTLLAIISPLIQLIQNPKKLITIVIGLIGIAALWFISYSLSTKAIDPDILIKTNTPESVVRYVGAGLLFTYFIFALAIISILYSEISKAFK